jgi:hypothetical protein
MDDRTRRKSTSGVVKGFHQSAMFKTLDDEGYEWIIYRLDFVLEEQRALTTTARLAEKS